MKLDDWRHTLAGRRHGEGAELVMLPRVQAPQMPAKQRSWRGPGPESPSAAEGSHCTDTVTLDFQPLGQDTHIPHPSVQGTHTTSCQAPAPGGGCRDDGAADSRARPRGLSRKTLSPAVMAQTLTLPCKEANGLGGSGGRGAVPGQQAGLGWDAAVTHRTERDTGVGRPVWLAQPLLPALGAPLGTRRLRSRG